ncbi:mannosylfructose-phosphate synthase-like [Ptychodera flava]|uniref:mannosylfructose-phosphate synthase-like n=1 Tax=Ptychodera flava TaxID=63121 RepID=UPI00396A9073
MFEHFKNKFRVDEAMKRKHHEFIPVPDKEFFDVKFTDAESTKTKQVITFGRITGVEKLKGYDLVARAMSEVAELFKKMRQPVPHWIIRGVPEGEGKKTKEALKKHVKCKDLTISLYPYGSQDDIRTDLKQSHLCVMASRSEPFGLVGFEAIATGIPVLVTKNSGLAEFLQEQFPDIAQLIVVDVGVNEEFDDDDVKQWTDAILGALNNYSPARTRADKLKRKIRECDAVKESQENFKKLCEGQ